MEVEPWRRGLFDDDDYRAAPATPPRAAPAIPPASPEVLAAAATAAPFASADDAPSKALRALAKALATPERPKPPTPPPVKPPSPVDVHHETDAAAAAAKAMEARFNHATARLVESDQRLHAAERERDRALDGEARALLELEAAMKRCAAAEAARAASDARSLSMEARSHDDGGDAARRALAEVRKELDGARAELLRERHAHFERAEPPDAMAETWTRAVDPSTGYAYRFDGKGNSVWEAADPPDQAEVEEAYFTVAEDEGPKTMLAATQIECSRLKAQVASLQAQVASMHRDAVALRTDYAKVVGDRDAWRAACEDARRPKRDPAAAALRKELEQARHELEKRGRELAVERCRAQAAVRKRENVVKRNEALEEEVATAKRLAAEAKLAARARRGFDAPDVIEARRETKEALGKAADLAREAARVATHLAGARQEGDAAKAELTDLKIKLAAAVEASTVEKRKTFSAEKNAQAARAQLLKQITRADALAAGKASADAAAAHSKRVAERAKDAAHQRVSRAASEFARYRTAVEARLRDTAPPPPSAFERMGSASARHLRKKRVLSPSVHPRTPVATTRRGYGR